MDKFGKNLIFLSQKNALCIFFHIFFVQHLSCRSITINTQKDDTAYLSKVQIAGETYLEVSGIDTDQILEICSKSSNTNKCIYHLSSETIIKGLDPGTYEISTLKCKGPGSEKNFDCKNRKYRGSFDQEKYNNQYEYFYQSKFRNYESLTMQAAINLHEELIDYKNGIHRCSKSKIQKFPELNNFIEQYSKGLSDIEKSSALETVRSLQENLIQLIKIKVHSQYDSADPDNLSLETPVQKYIVELINYRKKVDTSSPSFYDKPWYERIGIKAAGVYTGGYHGHSAVLVKVYNEVSKSYDVLRYVSFPNGNTLEYDLSFFNEHDREIVTLPPVKDQQIERFLTYLDKSPLLVYNEDFMFDSARKIRDRKFKNEKDFKSFTKNKSFKNAVKKMMSFEDSIRRKFTAEIPIRFFDQSDNWTLLDGEKLIQLAHIPSQISEEQFKESVNAKIRSMKNVKEAEIETHIANVAHVLDEIIANVKKNKKPFSDLLDDIKKIDNQAETLDQNINDTGKLLSVETELAFRKVPMPGHVQNELQKKLHDKITQLRVVFGVNPTEDLMSQLYKYKDISRKKSVVELFSDLQGFEPGLQTNERWKKWLGDRYDDFIKNKPMEMNREQFIAKYSYDLNSNGLEQYSLDFDLKYLLSKISIYNARIVEQGLPKKNFDFLTNNCACAAGKALNQIYDTDYFKGPFLLPKTPEYLQSKGQRYADAYLRSVIDRNPLESASSPQKMALKLAPIVALISIPFIASRTLSSNSENDNKSLKLLSDRSIDSDQIELEECLENARIQVEDSLDEITMGVLGAGLEMDAISTILE